MNRSDEKFVEEFVKEHEELMEDLGNEENMICTKPNSQIELVSSTVVNAQVLLSSLNRVGVFCQRSELFHVMVMNQIVIESHGLDVDKFQHSVS